MKFLPTEHQSISHLLENAGIPKEKVTFGKKRGQLHIEIQGRADSFCFYRKTTSRLNSNLQFVDETSYYLGSKKEVVVTDWEAVLAAIKSWL